jgi:MFS transporter, DHA1 family, tetracycline resistance protein
MRALINKIIRNQAFIVIFAIIFTDLLGFGLIIPILPKLSQDLNISGFKMGLLLSSYSMAQFVAGPILGSLSDKYGRRPVLLISKFGTVIAYLILALTRTYYLILFARLVDGFTGGNITIARAYIRDITTLRNRSRGMALIGIAYALGFIVGPVIGGIFFGIRASLFLPAMVGASMCFVSFLLTLFFLKESESEHVDKPQYNFLISFKKSLSNFGLRNLLFVQAIFMFCASAYISTLAIFASSKFDLSPRSISFIIVYTGIINIFIQSLILKYGSKNIIKTTKYGLLLTSFGMLSLAIIPIYSVIFIAIAISSVGTGLINAYLPTLLLAQKHEDPDGEMIGTYESTGSLACVFGPMIAGSLIHSIPTLVYVGTSVLVAFSSVFVNNRLENND